MVEEIDDRPARRFLHVCYCCDDKSATTTMLTGGLGLRHAWTSPTGHQSAAILGLGDVVSGADFVFDGRGPRTSPAIEVQEWREPEVVGAPYDDPTAVGVHALGFAVPDVGAAVRELTAAGSKVVSSDARLLGSGSTTLRDANGVTIDLVDDPSIPAGECRMRHLRITVSDLAASVRWYECLGFDVVDEVTIEGGALFGLDGDVRADAARLRLPDEPYEALLVQWRTPTSHGRHYVEPNHAGLYRAALGVDDTRAAHAALAAAGVAFDLEPVSVELTGTPVPDMWICFLSDPDGIPYELVERPRSSFRP